MTSYRLYVLNPQERIASALEEQFVDDARALAQARAVRDDNYAVEVWSGERLVGRIGGEFRID